MSQTSRSFVERDLSTGGNDPRPAGENSYTQRLGCRFHLPFTPVHGATQIYLGKPNSKRQDNAACFAFFPLPFGLWKKTILQTELYLYL